MQMFLKKEGEVEDGELQGGDSNNPNYTYTASSSGGNAAHNNMPPYLTVYVWKRVA